jgi:predicted aminopeptidase
MPFYTGRTGKLRLSDNEVAKVRDWALDVSMDPIETTALGDTAQSYTAGMSSATGNATVSYYTGAATGVVQLLQKIVTTGAITDDNQVELTFEVGADQYFKANAFITNASISSSTNELTSVSFQFTVNGALTTVETTGTV